MPAKPRADRYPGPVRTALADQVAHHLLTDIVEGLHPAGTQLPPEAELARQTDVSRLTLREAIKSLQQRGVVSVEQGRGTFVTPHEQWAAFDPLVLAARAAGANGLTLAIQLTEVRRVVEVGAVELAARRRTGVHLARMRASLTEADEALRANDVTAFAEADIAFHDAVLAAAGNPLLGPLLMPIGAALRTVRLRTSYDRPMCERAVTLHSAIYDAVRRRATRRATATMARHIDETRNYIATKLGGTSSLASRSHQAAGPEPLTTGWAAP